MYFLDPGKNKIFQVSFVMVVYGEKDFLVALLWVATGTNWQQGAVSRSLSMVDTKHVKPKMAQCCPRWPEGTIKQHNKSSVSFTCVLPPVAALSPLLPGITSDGEQRRNAAPSLISDLSQSNQSMVVALTQFLSTFPSTFFLYWILWASEWMKCPGFTRSPSRTTHRDSPGGRVSDLTPCCSQMSPDLNQIK